MSPKPSRRSAKEELMRRLEGDYNKKQGGGSLFRTDLKGVTFWSCKDGDHLFDIIPYQSGDMDPFEPGSESYVLEFFVHAKIGAQEQQVICMAETFKKPCPICEERRRLIKKGDDEQKIKDLTPSRYPRSIYNIVCYDSKEEENKGVQVWHTSNFLLQQYLLALAKRPIRPGQKSVEPFIAFMDVEEGKSIAFKREGKKENTKFIGIRFEDRNYKIDDEISNQAHCLDQLIAWPTYDEVYSLFWMTDAPGTKTGEDDVPPSVGRERKYEEKAEESEPATRGRRSEPEPEKEEPKEEAPPTRGRRQTEPPPEEPPARSRRQSSDDEDSKGGGNKCPAGKKFGVDIDELKECDKCSAWKDCAKEADAIEKAKKK
jgi:hypothetical protein